MEEEPTRVIKSVYESQSDILLGILKLCGLESFDADITYGNGSFYSAGVPQPRLKFDIDPQVPGVEVADSALLPLADASLRSIVFDPPFLTYVRTGRTGNGSMVMSGRFGGYWRYDELEAHYRATLKEAGRVLSAEGILVFKCQDIVHNHRLHPTHAYVMQWAEECGFRLKDLFILPAKHRLPSPNRGGKQKHARIHHSYFLVLTRLKGKR
jgi:tRNA G10  N-methylase Trm11